MGKYKAYAESAHTISPHLQNTIFMCAVFGDFPQTHVDAEGWTGFFMWEDLNANLNWPEGRKFIRFICLDKCTQHIDDIAFLLFHSLDYNDNYNDSPVFEPRPYSMDHIGEQR